MIFFVPVGRLNTERLMTITFSETSPAPTESADVLETTFAFEDIDETTPEPEPDNESRSAVFNLCLTLLAFIVL